MSEPRVIPLVRWYAVVNDLTDGYGTERSACYRRVKRQFADSIVIMTMESKTSKHGGPRPTLCLDVETSRLTIAGLFSFRVCKAPTGRWYAVVNDLADGYGTYRKSARNRVERAFPEDRAVMALSSKGGPHLTLCLDVEPAFMSGLPSASAIHPSVRLRAPLLIP